METPDEMQARWAKAIAEAGAATEVQMREAKVPFPQSIEELAEYVKKLVDRPHDYGTCVYAMSMAAEAAYNFVSHALGVTGFQASCADMDFLRRTRGMQNGFMILNGNDVLYPQYDLMAKTEKFVADRRAKLADEAKRLLAESPNAHPDVLAHWERLARGDA